MARCKDCGGRDYTCGRCGEYYVPYQAPDLPALVGPYRGRCGLCGDSDARHRILDAIVGRAAAGEDSAITALDYEVSEAVVRRIVKEYVPTPEVS